jgi:hypothetical protein
MKKKPASEEAQNSRFSAAKFVSLMNYRLSHTGRDEAAAQPSNEDDGPENLSYSVQFTEVGSPSGVTAGFVQIVTRAAFKSVGIKVEADYVVGMDGDCESEEQVSQLLGDSINAVVWPRFRDLFAIVSSQTQFPFPPLPAVAKYKYVPRDQIRPAKSSRVPKARAAKSK